MPEARTVWITRAAPAADRTAERVAALGWRPLVAPLLVVRPVKAALTLDPGEALAFTSSQALHHLDPTTPRGAMVFAVGDATAEAARAAGFTDVRSAAGDVEALATLILKARPAAVLHPAAARTAGDLVRRLSEAGLPARRVTVYRAEACTAPPAAAMEALSAGALAAVLIHSPRAGQIAAELIVAEGGGRRRRFRARPIPRLRRAPCRRRLRPRPRRACAAGDGAVALVGVADGGRSDLSAALGKAARGR